MATEIRAKIALKWWRVILTRDIPNDLDGFTESHNLNGRPRKRKRVLISSKLKGQLFLETVLHETLHAAMECIDETAVEMTAADQAALFCRDELLAQFLRCPAIRERVLKILDIPDPLDDEE